MDFPHINDTNFPNLNTVDVYRFQNDFDYARWQGKVSIKLLNVLWNSNYADVPGFENDLIRDAWFTKQNGMVQTLESGFNITPDNSIKIPIPYNDAYRYNYLMVDMPMQTSDNQPIDYENEQTRVKRWYYFIDSMTQYAPNTTELFVTLDVWTTFSNTVEIPYLMLERGHAPMLKTKVEDYLANPIENNEYLLAEDFNYGTSNRNVSTSTYFPIGNGRKYVLFAVPITQANFANLGGSDLSGNSTPPTFSNTTERWGYQIVVNNYEWKYGDVSYENAKLPITSFLNEDSVFNGNLVFAIESENAFNFFNDVANNCVHLLHAIQGVFVVAEDMIKIASTFTFRGFTLYQVNKQYQVYDLQLNKEAFDYDDKYSNIAKLYTYPYSVIEITDDNGFTNEVRIENTGNMKLHKEISIAFPYVRYQSFFTGMNGTGKLNYTWKNLNNGNVKKEIWEDDFSKLMMNWDIPTFAVFASAEQEYAVSHYFGNKARRQGAIIGYENAVRYANTNRANIADSYQTNTDNTADSMQTVYDNNETACDTAEYNVISIHNPKMEDALTYQNQKIEDDADTASGLNWMLTGIRNDYAAIAYGNNSTAQIANSAIGALAGTFGMAGSASVTGSGNPSSGAIAGAVGGIAGQIQSTISVQAAGANLVASVTNDTQVCGAMEAGNDAYASNATTCNTNVMRNAQAENAAIMNSNNDSAREQTERIVDTNNGNAERTQGTETANAGYTRNAHVVAEQHNLEQIQREVEAQYLNNRLGNPVFETDYSGDAYPDVFERRGIRMNIRTQTKSAIAQAGDAMLRFGYALHRVWDMKDGFHYGKHFTFWKAEDIWINEGSGVAGNAVNIIGDILLKGVTIWRNPDEIGKASIYDNI